MLLLQAGTIVDATIISAPSSTKNAAKARDPEMRQTRKGKQWYFGMKLHVGTDVHGLVHHVRASDAAVADIAQLPALLHGTERVLYGDQAYWMEDHRVGWTLSSGPYRVNRRGTRRIPSPGSRSRYGGSAWVYDKLRRFRAGIESGISLLKRVFGLARCVQKAAAGFHAYVRPAVLAANLLLLARHRLA